MSHVPPAMDFGINTDISLQWATILIYSDKNILFFLDRRNYRFAYFLL